MQKSHVQRSPRNLERGMLLISSLLIISLFLVYSSTLALRTVTQQRVATQLHDRLQAMDEAQGAVEQLRDQLFANINTQMGPTGNALAAFTWLQGVGGETFTTSGQKAEVLLPTTLPGSPGRAWVSRVCVDPADEGPTIDCLPDTRPFAARNVTINATATIGSVTKQVQATYRVQLDMSDIFKNAYFANNYGWFELEGSGHVLINGDVRANGNLDFKGNMARLFVNGDLFASVNSELGVPGDITGTGIPSQFSDLWQYHASKNLAGAFDPAAASPANWNYWKTRSRPARQLTLPGQPPIGGGDPKRLPGGMGWDGNEAPAEREFSRQPMHPMPYMGDLSGEGSFYRGLAARHEREPTLVWPNSFWESGFAAGAGSKLKYQIDTDGDGNYFDVQVCFFGFCWGENGAETKTLTQAYDPVKGPDQQLETPDDGKPLVLWGNPWRPIEIDGPVVIPGDVIIRGFVRGRGTVYAGRNVHIVGEVRYLDGPQWAAVERNTDDGTLRQLGAWWNLGRLCPPDNTFTTGACPE